eukprot:scaffold156680_cov40-Tisochrysis_lutea.AAC.2
MVGTATSYFYKWGSMGASRPPHSIADTFLGGPAQPTPAPALCPLARVGISPGGALSPLSG